MALAVGGLVRIQDMADYGDAQTWAGLHTFNAGLEVADGQVATIERINAVDGDGLSLRDDGGYGLTIQDEGNVKLSVHTEGQYFLDFYSDWAGPEARIGAFSHSSGNLVLSALYGSKRMYLQFGQLYLREGGDTRLYINANGLIGINQTAPDAQLHITSSAVGTSGAIIEAAAGVWASDYLQIRTNGATNGDILTIDSDGHLGINIVAPAGQAHIDQSSDTGAIPVLALDQADISEGFINFIGSDRGVINGATNSVASVRVELDGTVYRLALYADA